MGSVYLSGWAFVVLPPLRPPSTPSSRERQPRPVSMQGVRAGIVWRSAAIVVHGQRRHHGDRWTGGYARLLACTAETSAGLESTVPVPGDTSHVRLTTAALVARQRESRGHALVYFVCLQAAPTATQPRPSRLASMGKLSGGENFGRSTGAHGTDVEVPRYLQVLSPRARRLRSKQIGPSPVPILPPHYAWVCRHRRNFFFTQAESAEPVLVHGLRFTLQRHRTKKTARCGEWATARKGAGRRGKGGKWETATGASGTALSQDPCEPWPFRLDTGRLSVRGSSPPKADASPCVGVEMARSQRYYQLATGHANTSRWVTL
jgi:hypothetical protein